VLDSPVGQHHGGVVSGPVFKRIAEQVLAYMGVPHDVPTPTDVETARNQQEAPDGARADDGDGSAEERFQEAVVTGSADGPVAAPGDPRAVPVPDLTGQTVRGVMEECSHLGLAPALIGSGVALEQFPGAGTQVLRGGRVTVRFGRASEFVKASAQGLGN
jgi:cell division protein FtsI (penicillin-binding protein 3)